VTDGQGSPLAHGAGTRDAPAGRATRAVLWWALLVVPLWAVLVLCTHWEPVMRDGWNHLVWLRNHPTDDRGFYDFIWHSYRTQNPRLGQIPTMLTYLRGPYHVIVTPLLELAVLALLTAVALGRWPSLRRTGDALAAALVAAILAACVPQVGPMLFYRPFTWNYVFGLGLNLWWLVPYRLELVRPRSGRRWLTPALFVLGIAAGLCNEHTGVAFAAMAALASFVAWRRGGLRAWMIAGLAGLITGYAVLLTAPAQQVRYGALAQQAGIVARIVDRGVLGNLGVLGALGLALLPALPLVGIGLAQRRARDVPALADRGSCAVLALAGLVCTLTLLASPKLGPRLYFASVALIAVGLTGWLIGRLATPGARRACAVLAAGALVFVAIRLVAIHRVVGPIGAVRRDLVEHSRIGSVVTVPRFPSGVSRYFLGDDLVVPSARELLAREYGLMAIEFETAER
jgi:hypothetical protein